MTRIPIDLDVPIACTASGSDLEGQLAALEHLRRRVAAIERTADGLHLAFPADEALHARLERFVQDEKGCCRFWGFGLDADDERIDLQWSGPPSAQPILDELDRWFRGDEPLAALSGLL
jgi:hypothetical protein